MHIGSNHIANVIGYSYSQWHAIECTLLPYIKRPEASVGF